jgi:hypothetical protein
MGNSVHSDSVRNAINRSHSNRRESDGCTETTCVMRQIVIITIATSQMGNEIIGCDS